MHARILGCLLVIALTAGCASRAPRSAIASNTTPERIGLNQFVMYFSSRVERVADDIANLTRDPEVARRAVYFKMRAIPLAQAALLIADNQVAGIQLWVLSAALEEALSGPIGTQFKAGQPIAVDASKEIVERVSGLVSGMLTPEQYKQAEQEIAAFVKEHVGSAGMKYTPGEASTWSETMSGVLRKPLDLIEAPLSSLNPTSGFSDTALAVQNFSDEFSRARTEMGYMPSSLRWNAELLLLEFEEAYKLSSVVDSVGQVGASATSLAETAKALPGELRKELTTFAEDLGKPQSELQATLEVANTTLTNSQQTAEAVDAMGATLTGTFGAFIELMGTFGLPDDAPPSPPEDDAPPTPSEDKAPPYDVNDYGRAAEKVTVMADSLTALLSEAGAITNAEQPPALLADTEATTRSILADTETKTRSLLSDTETKTRSVLADTEAMAASLVDRIFIWAAALVLFTALVAFVYRVAVARRTSS